MIVALSDEGWLQWPIEILVLETVLSHLKCATIRMKAYEKYPLLVLFLSWFASCICMESQVVAIYRKRGDSTIMLYCLAYDWYTVLVVLAIKYV